LPAAALALLTLAACSGITRITETPQLGVSTGGAPTASVPTAVRPTESAQPGQATVSPEPTEPPAPTLTPTASLPEGAILLPTLARSGELPPPNTPVPVFPPGALEATRAAAPPPVPEVGIYNAVYQRYQGGAMLYLAEMRQIWVMIETPGKRGGPYYRFEDLFVDGDVESIEGLTVPPGLLQPHRGFGRIWREQPGLRSQLGWAADYEIPFTMRAGHVASGAFDATGNFVASGTLWMMTMHDNSIAYFNEVTNTWGIASSQ
jgi:hypothetical protein